jgi:hypothetical protein
MARFTAFQAGLKALAVSGRSFRIAAVLLRPSTLGAVAHPRPSAPTDVAYRGEIWTDGRGSATVHLPTEADLLAPSLEYELRLDPLTSARVTAGLEYGRFTIETDQPYVKVAWQVSRRTGVPR